MKKHYKKIIVGLLLLSSLALVFVDVFYVNSKSTSPAKAVNATPAATVAQGNPQEGIQPELVCMVNDAFMGKKQIPVPVGDKVYYGCCEMCVGRIHNDKSVRFAQDPLTDEQVDKSKAFIVRKSSGSDAVLYFATKDHYQQYLQKQQ